MNTLEQAGQSYMQQVNPTRLALLAKIEDYKKSIIHAQEQITNLEKVVVLFPEPIGYSQMGTLGMMAGGLSP